MHNTFKLSPETYSYIKASLAVSAKRYSWVVSLRTWTISVAVERSLLAVCGMEYSLRWLHTCSRTTIGCQELSLEGRSASLIAVWKLESGNVANLHQTHNYAHIRYSYSCILDMFMHVATDSVTMARSLICMHAPQIANDYNICHSDNTFFCARTYTEGSCHVDMLSWTAFGGVSFTDSCVI